MFRDKEWIQLQSQIWFHTRSLLFREIQTEARLSVELIWNENWLHLSELPSSAISRHWMKLELGSLICSPELFFWLGKGVSGSISHSLLRYQKEHYSLQRLSSSELFVQRADVPKNWLLHPMMRAQVFLFQIRKNIAHNRVPIVFVTFWSDIQKDSFPCSEQQWNHRCFCGDCLSRPRNSLYWRSSRDCWG
jgi:hypothetical protein